MPSNCHNIADSFSVPPGHWFEGFLSLLLCRLLGYFEKQCLFQFFFSFSWNPAMTSAVNGFPKQCVPHIELIRWNMGRHTKLRTKSGSKKWELSLEKKKILQLEAYDNVLCHWGASRPEFGCHGFTFDYAGFLIFWLDLLSLQVHQPEQQKR